MSEKRTLVLLWLPSFGAESVVRVIIGDGIDVSRSMGGRDCAGRAGYGGGEGGEEAPEGI